MNQGDTGKVNINRNPRVPEGAPLPYPVHKVLGMLPTEEAAWNVIDELKAEGIPEEEIELWGGHAGAEAIDKSFSKSGLKGRLARLVHELGEEGEDIRRYDEALRSGQFLLVVPAPRSEFRESVRDSMVKQGGHLITYYDQLTTETLAE